MSNNGINEKKRILFVVEAMGGGVYTYMVDLANALSNKYEVYIAYATRPQTPGDYEEAFAEGIHLIEVKNFTRSINFLKDMKAFAEVRKIAKEVKPDVIHLHSSKAGAIGRFAFNCKKIPLFYTPHGYSFLMQNYSSVKRLIYRLIEQICGKSGCITISCSEGEHKETLKLTKRAAYINNGIKIEQLNSVFDSSKELSEHKFTIFTLGRICYQKNPELFNEVATKMPEFRFLWIGDGELRDRLTAPNIEVTGWVTRDKALELAVETDVFILTSLWEGLPISLLEAMYMKKICIVSNSIGNRDVIKSGYNGFVCNNAEEYVNILKELNDYDIDSILENAHNDILRQYNTEVMTKQYIKLYEKELRK